MGENPNPDRDFGVQVLGRPPLHTAHAWRISAGA
jgi:hypothetical protein